MKRLFVLFATMAMVACGGSSGGGGGTTTTTATTPVDSRCINSSTLCNNGVYAQYNGWRPYSYPYSGVNYNYSTYFNSYGVCGCPFGYQPAYNSTMGLGCYRTPYQGWNYNMQWAFNYYPRTMGAPQGNLNRPQVSNIPNAGGGNCTGNVATSCLMNQVNSCGAGATCQEVLTGSGLGVCVSGGYGYGNTMPYGYGNVGAGVGVGINVGVGFGWGWY